MSGQAAAGRAMRIAVAGASTSTTAMLRKAVPGLALEAWTPSAEAALPDVLVVDVARAAVAPSPRDLGLGAAAPRVLLLLGAGAHVDEQAWSSIAFTKQQKPLNIEALARKLRALVEEAATAKGPLPAEEASLAGRCAEASEHAAPLDWLAWPRVPTWMAALVPAAARAGGAAWIVGEPGAGAVEFAAALAQRSGGEDPVVWEAAEPLGEALARLGKRTALWVPSPEARTADEQEALARWLATRAADRTVVATSETADPAVARPDLVPALALRLERLVLALPPLRERGEDVAKVARGLAADLARRCFAREGFELTDAAVATLQEHGWPGNQAELEAVLARSLMAAGPAATALDEGDLVFDGDDLPGVVAAKAASRELAGSTSEAPPARGVVLAFPQPGTRAAGAPEASRDDRPDGASPRLHERIEGLLGALAHEMLNPMTTLSTFVEMAARAAAQSPDKENGSLLEHAVEACRRITEQQELLQAYGEVVADDAARAQARGLDGGTVAEEQRAEAPATDLVDHVGDAIEQSGSHQALALLARSAVRATGRPEALAFVATALVGEAAARHAPSSEPGTVDATEAGRCLLVRLPGRAAADRLAGLVQGGALPWRLALAADVASREGGQFEVTTEDEGLRIAWRPAAASSQAHRPATAAAVNVEEEVEVAGHGEQARGADRGRRTRGS